jgi:hypothetical protein
MALLILTVGDWSNDGHGMTAEIVFESNRDAVELQEAYTRGVAIVGFDLSQEVAANYDDALFPTAKLELLEAHGFADHKDDDNETAEWYEDDAGYMIDPDGFADAYLFIASLGDPALVYKRVPIPRVTIGGYGLFIN